MLGKIKHLFKKQDEILKPVEFEKGSDTIVFSGIVYHNDYINICHDTCTVCYNKDGSWRDLNKRRAYLDNKIKVGHESILQHSNVIIKVSFELNEDKNINYIYKTISEGFTGVRNKHLLYYIVEEENAVCAYVKGNILAFKNYIRFTEETTNYLYRAIKGALYELDPCILGDFIKDGILDANKFIPGEYEINIAKYGNEIKVLYDGEYLDLIGCNEDYLISLCQTLDFRNIEILETATVTVFFKKMPRVISQMITRHDNAITQLSQRYTDCRGMEFLPPIDVDQEEELNISILGEHPVHVNALKLGQLIMHIYGQLLNESNGYRKEQARAYLPNNTNTQLYVTYTLKNLIHFLNLRTDKAAQIDIVKPSQELEKASKQIFGGWIDPKFIEPLYQAIGREIEEELDIDEPIGKVQTEKI